MTLLRDLARFFWRRDSESASLLIMELTGWLTDKDLRDMGDYLASLRRYKLWSEEPGDG